MFQTVLSSLNQGFLKSLEIFALTLAGAIPLGLLISLGSMNRLKLLQYPVKFIVWIVRGTPLMLQLLIIYYGPGMLLGNNWWGSGSGGRFVAAIVTFIFNYACYFSEIFRGGIESIPHGQYEAGQVLGMTRGQIFRKIILKQVVKRILPPMSNEVITLVKDTSLANVIAIPEIIKRAKDMAATQALTWPLFYTGVFYLLFVGALTLLFGYAEKRLSYFKA